MSIRRHGQGRWVGRQEGWALLVVALASSVCWPALARAQQPDSVRITWTAPADGPGAETVATYDVRAYAIPITPSNFLEAQVVPAPTPRAPGQTETLVVRGLTPGQTYWFAIRSADRAGNWSALSNVVAWNPPLDGAPPAPPTGLACEFEAAGGYVRLDWNPNAEADLAGYSIYRAADPLGEWTRLTDAPQTETTFFDGGAVGQGDRFWYVVTASDWSHNESARSEAAVVVIRGAQTAYPAAWHLNPPFPNPARPGVVTHLPIEAPVNRDGARLEIVDAAGQVVRHLSVRPAAPGFVQVDWDGRNDRGVACAPGIYRAHLIAGSTRQVVRVARVP